MEKQIYWFQRCYGCGEVTYRENSHLIEMTIDERKPKKYSTHYNKDCEQKAKERLCEDFCKSLEKMMRR
ncbi:MAG: hypothetical protein WC781_04570 [Candidatus Pacearchaeota archaeon]|jgi:hypothetical protein